MMRQERAKQFMPFDAMKGLQEALRDREERHSRVEQRELGEEQIERNGRVLERLAKGMSVRLEYYHAFHDTVRTGRVSAVSIPMGFLSLEGEKIYFTDIYSIEITEFIPDP